MAYPLVTLTELGRASSLTLEVGLGWASGDPCRLPAQPHSPVPVITLTDLLAREAQFVVTIGNVRGVLDSSILDPEPGPEGPFISYSYYVTYDFVEDEDKEGNISRVEEIRHDSVLDEVCPAGPGSRVALTQVCGRLYAHRAASRGSGTSLA